MGNWAVILLVVVAAPLSSGDESCKCPFGWWQLETTHRCIIVVRNNHENVVMDEAGNWTNICDDMGAELYSEASPEEGTEVKKLLEEARILSNTRILLKEGSRYYTRKVGTTDENTPANSASDLKSVICATKGFRETESVCPDGWLGRLINGAQQCYLPVRRQMPIRVAFDYCRERAISRDERGEMHTSELVYLESDFEWNYVTELARLLAPQTMLQTLVLGFSRCDRNLERQEWMKYHYSVLGESRPSKKHPRGRLTMRQYQDRKAFLLRKTRRYKDTWWDAEGLCCLQMLLNDYKGGDLNDPKAGYYYNEKTVTGAPMELTTCNKYVSFFICKRSDVIPR